MKRLLIVAMTAVLGAAGASAGTAAKGPSKRYLVTFEEGTKPADRDAALAALELTPKKMIASEDEQNTVSIAIVDVAAGQTLTDNLGKAVCKNPQGCAAALRKVAKIEEDVRCPSAKCKAKWIESSYASMASAELPSFGAVMGGLKMPKASQFVQNPMAAQIAAQRGEDTLWGLQRLMVPAAWSVCENKEKKTCMGEGATVAVIDTGIDYRHKDLVGQVIGGYSAITKSENPTDWDDDNGHGSHVAGTIAGKRDGKGVVGVAPLAKLYAIKVLDGDGSGNLSDVVDGIVWAARMASKGKLDVANMSLGAPVDSDAMKRAVRFARGSGLVIVAAAGNTGAPKEGQTSSVGFPGAYDDVIAVAASDSKDKIAGFSSRGPEVDFIAPGVDILSVRAGGSQDKPASYSGTSMASPHVAGLAAIAAAQGYSGLNGPQGVFEQLKNAATSIKLTATEEGAGMIDAGKLAR